MGAAVVSTFQYVCLHRLLQSSDTLQSSMHVPANLTGKAQIGTNCCCWCRIKQAKDEGKWFEMPPNPFIIKVRNASVSY